jgi:hypothetical protein
MLRRHEPDDTRTADIAQQRHRMDVARVDRRLVGEKPEATTAQQRAPVVYQYVEPRENGRHAPILA